LNKVPLKRHSRCCAAKLLGTLLLLGALAAPAAPAAANRDADLLPALRAAR
jgi:hypothetical protein